MNKLKVVKPVGSGREIEDKMSVDLKYETLDVQFSSPRRCY